MLRTINIRVNDELELFVETYGKPENEACLFISGAGANSSFWSDSLCYNLVNERFYVIKYDHRDFGYSSKINWEEYPYIFMDLVKDAILILDSLKVEKAHMIGHSMGGFIAQSLAINYPDRVLSMTSISSSTNSPDIPPPPNETWEIFMESSPQNDFNKDLDGFLKVWKYLNGSARFDEELAIAYTKNIYDRQIVDGALGKTHVLAQQTLTDRSVLLSEIKCPALIIHGEKDYLVDVYGGVQTAESIPNSKLVVIPKMGHIPFNFEILERFENEIVEFLRDNKVKAIENR